MNVEITLTYGYPGEYTATAEIAGELVTTGGEMMPSGALEAIGDLLDAEHDRMAERQYDARHEGEPPVTLREQQIAAWEQKRALEDGRL